LQKNNLSQRRKARKENFILLKPNSFASLNTLKRQKTRIQGIEKAASRETAFFVDLVLFIKIRVVSHHSLRSGAHGSRHTLLWIKKGDPQVARITFKNLFRFEDDAGVSHL
jgi:hypothetical protein